MAAVFILLAFSSLSGQSTSGDSLNAEPAMSISYAGIDEVISFGETLLGRPYRYRADGGRTLDCSGYVSYIFHQQGIELPRSSSAMAAMMNRNRVSLKEVQKGDLMFFKGRNARSNSVGHVSMVVAVDGAEIEMMHSCSRGILRERYNSNRYYTQRFLFAARIPRDTTAVDPVKDSISSLPEMNHAEPVLPKPIAPTDTIKIPVDTMTKKVLSSNIKIIGVGDIMLGTNYPSDSYLPPNDGKDLLTPVKEILIRGDITFGNLEGVLLSGKGTAKRCSDPAKCYVFKMPDHYVNYLKEAGFDVVSVANNHVNDFGSEGTKNTMKVLTETGIHFAGLSDCPYTTFDTNGVTIGFVAFAPNRGTVSIHDYENARAIITHLDTISDIVIVSFHGGAEGPTKTHITRKKEFFLGEDRGNPYEFARMAIDAGADVVFGHGPHVTRAIDLYKDRFIAYSLGNFATYGRFSLSGPNGIAPIVEIDVDSTGRFLGGKIHSIKQPGRGGPVPDSAQKALAEIIRLTKTDIPECSLAIQPDGTIVRKNP